MLLSVVSFDDQLISQVHDSLLMSRQSGAVAWADNERASETILHCLVFHFELPFKKLKFIFKLAVLVLHSIKSYIVFLD